MKVTPFKRNKNGTISAKERLVICMINYHGIVRMDFYTSNLWAKIQNILMVFYLWLPKDIVENRLDYRIHYVYLYKPIEEDLAIIQEDFQTIKGKVLAGKAHELSEGDTIYLGAATKSSTSKNRTTQPFSDITAKPRAFSFKTSYMTYLLRNHVTKVDERNDRIVKSGTVDNFEKYVIEKINKYIGWKQEDLFIEFDLILMQKTNIIY